MKRSSFSHSLTSEQIEAAIAAAPDAVSGDITSAVTAAVTDSAIDVELEANLPYNSNDVASVAKFWEGALVTQGGGAASVIAAMAARRRPGQRGLGKRQPKVAINIRLSPEVLDAFKSTGNGWQTRVDGALKNWLSEHSASDAS